VTGQPDAELDLRGVICPYNFVKTKLKLEAMEQGQILSVLLDDGDPIRNVSRSVSNEGHTILSEDRIEGAYRVVIRRREPLIFLCDLTPYPSMTTVSLESFGTGPI
jgi:tRNA 2-thiouridine synthesizing protein A